MQTNSGPAEPSAIAVQTCIHGVECIAQTADTCCRAPAVAEAQAVDVEGEARDLAKKYAYYPPDSTIGELVEMVARLIAALAALREERDELRAFFEELWREQWATGYGIDGAQMLDMAERRGLLVEVPADDRIRAEYETDTMLTWKWSPDAPRKENEDERES